MSVRCTDWNQIAVIGSDLSPLSLCELTISGDDIALAHHKMGSVSWTMTEGNGLVISYESGLGWFATRMMPQGEFMAEFLQPFMFLPFPEMTFEIICQADQVDGSDLEYTDALTGKVDFFLEGTVEEVKPDEHKLLLTGNGGRVWISLTASDIASAKLGEFDSYGHSLSLQGLRQALSDEKMGQSLFRLMRRLEPLPDPIPQTALPPQEETKLQIDAKSPHEEERILPGDIAKLYPRASRYKTDRH